MALTYRFLTTEQQAAIREQRTGKPAPPDDATIAAWERDHYGHSLAQAEATDPNVKKRHADAMRQIETAIQKARAGR